MENLFIEFHDAVVDSIACGPGRTVRLIFSHLAVYRRESEVKFGVWSARAELVIDDVDYISLAGDLPRHQADSLSFVQVVARDESDVEGAALLSKVMEVRSVRWRWELSGFEGVVRGGKASLIVLDKGRRFESWVPEINVTPS